MTQEFVTLPREVVEQAVAYIEMLNAGKWTQVTALAATLRASLDQPQNHVPDAGNMVPDGWKLVPVEPTAEMQAGYLKAMSAPWVERYRDMLDAAPKPPTVKHSLTVEQQQANQPAMTPIAQRKLDSLMASGYTISGYSVYHEQKHQHGFVTGAGLVGWWKPEGVEYPQPLGEQEPFTVLIRKRSWLANQWEAAPRGFPDYGRSWADERVNVYTHQQPKRQPLTNERIDAIADAMPGGLEGFLKGWGWRQFARAVLEATNNIK